MAKYRAEWGSERDLPIHASHQFAAHPDLAAGIALDVQLKWSGVSCNTVSGLSSSNASQRGPLSSVWAARIWLEVNPSAAVTWASSAGFAAVR